MHNPLSSAARAARTTTPTSAEEVPARAPLRRRPWIAATAVAAVALGGVGVAVAADAHKTVSLDVDGSVVEVTTWAGSVGNLLAEVGVDTGTRDVVAPEAGAALVDGQEVVVRYARQVLVSDGEDTEPLWTTGLDAAEVLDTLEGREDSVHLVASRSSARTEIGVRLPLDGTAQLFVDGEVRPVADGTTEVDAALSGAGVELGPRDEVLVDTRAADGSDLAEGEAGVVTVVVRRIEVEERTRTKKVAHETETRKDSSRFTDEGTLVETKGVDGERTIVTRVTTVDGEVVDKEKLSDDVTTKPVTEVRVVGTKARPAPKPAKRSTSSASQGKAPSSGVWAKLAQCESGGRPGVVSANGLYHGLYQFSVSTWRSVGGSGLPSQASAAEQTKRAKMLQARSGWGQWPHCSSKLGLR